MFNRKNKKSLAIVTLLTALIIIAIAGCNNLNTTQNTHESIAYSNAPVARGVNDKLKEVDVFVCAGKWQVNITQEQNEKYGVTYFENLIKDFAENNGTRGTVELKALSEFITENIGDYEIVKEYPSTRGEYVVVIVDTPGGKHCIVVEVN